ncbi:MAG: hypothetical protein FWF97_02125 [Alphaproteobacteria bacterium]|nr:hypothetical protein [Alphaproteobacteria bacterium]
MLISTFFEIKRIIKDAKNITYDENTGDYSVGAPYIPSLIFTAPVFAVEKFKRYDDGGARPDGEENVTDLKEIKSEIYHINKIICEIIYHPEYLNTSVNLKKNGIFGFPKKLYNQAATKYAALNNLTPPRTIQYIIDSAKQKGERKS